MWSPISSSQVWSPVPRPQDKNLWNWPSPIAILVGLFLSWKGVRETITHLGGSYWGTVSSGAHCGELHWRVTLARIPQLLPQPLACLQRVLMRKEKRPQVQVRATKNVVVCVRVGKEFPDMRQNEQRIKFIRVGDTIRTAGWLKGEPNPFAG